MKHRRDFWEQRVAVFMCCNTGGEATRQVLTGPWVIMKYLRYYISILDILRYIDTLKVNRMPLKVLRY